MKVIIFLISIFNLVLVSLPIISQCFIFPKLQDDVLIIKTCNKTPYPDLCNSTLLAYPNSSKLEVQGLGGVILNSTLANAINTLNYIQELIDENTHEKMERPLADCAELYIPIVKYILPQAIVAYNKHQYGFASYCLSDASQQADKCEKEFSGSIKSPLTDRNKLAGELCDVSVAIVKTVQKG